MATRTTGTFAACWPDEESVRRLLEHFASVGGLKDAASLHVTVAYTGVELPSFASRSETFAVRPVGYDLFGDDGDILVLRVEGNEVRAIHEEFLEAGAERDEPVFNPHLTLSKTFDGELDDLPPPPDFDIRIDRMIVEALPRIRLGRVPRL